eukprot:679112-Prymnesium_polylepis.1
MDVSGDEFEPTEEEVAAEAARAPLVIVNADRWDHFLSWVHDIEVPWEEDTDDYRKLRALQYCNGARACPRVLARPTRVETDHGTVGPAHRVQHRAPTDCRSW